MYCKNCINYEKGFDGKPGNCLLKVADIWNGYDNLTNAGFGYSDENYDNELSVLYVGENFGCVNFKQDINALP